ncbi:MAG: folate family ECF transporter S component [Clostridia bacterium]|nr:folate family ECF transporter S component [Clostridia bacterium]
MSNFTNKNRTLVIDALMIALYVVLNTLGEIPIGNVKITFGPLPIILVAFYFGIGHASIVAGAGEFVSQMLGYGLTWTTPLWTVPPIARAVIICILLSLIFKRKRYDTVTQVKYYEYFIILFISGFLTTILNTSVIALDAIIYSYYSYAYVFGDLILRFITMSVSTVIYMFVAKAVIDALYKAKI